MSLGRRAFKFTRISMGSARPRMENIRYFLFGKNHIFRKNCKTSNRKKIGHFAKKWCFLNKNHIHYKSYRAHNPVLGRDRIVVDFDLIYLGDADIQVQADFLMNKVLNPSNLLKT